MAAALIWATVLLLPWQPWRAREHFSPDPDNKRDLGAVTAIIPARNEAGVIAATLDRLVSQGPGLRVIVVDDQSTDGTAELARRHGPANLQLLTTPPLPPEWSGKLWAL